MVIPNPSGLHLHGDSMDSYQKPRKDCAGRAADLERSKQAYPFIRDAHVCPLRSWNRPMWLAGRDADADRQERFIHLGDPEEASALPRFNMPPFSLRYSDRAVA